MSNDGIAIKSILLCDDFRTEDNGKQMLLGIYGPKLFIPKYPSKMRIALAIIADILTPGEHRIRLKATLDGEEELLKIDGTLEADDIGAGVVLGNKPVQIEIKKPGSIQIEYEHDGVWTFLQEWHVLSQLPDQVKAENESRPLGDV